MVDTPPVTDSGMESAVEAAARALAQGAPYCEDDASMCSVSVCECRQFARAALSAAKPHLEAELADTVARLEPENERLRAVVVLADAMYVQAAKEAQDRSDSQYKREFGIKGPSLAGFLRGGADRDYHYARHTAGECPLPRHTALAALDTEP